MIRPSRVPLEYFVDELAFFDLGADVMDSFWQSEGLRHLFDVCLSPMHKLLLATTIGYEKPAARILPELRLQRCVWQLMEHADSSPLARAIAMFSVFVIILSITNFCLETIKPLKVRAKSKPKPKPESKP